MTKRHIVNEMVQGIQTCTRCHEIIIDYRGTKAQGIRLTSGGINPVPVTQTGFVAGFVYVTQVGHSTMSSSACTGPFIECDEKQNALPSI